MNRSGSAMHPTNTMNPYNMGGGMSMPGNGPNGNCNPGFCYAPMYNRGGVPGNEMCSGGNCCPSMPHGAAPGNPSMPMMMSDKSESQLEKQMMNFPNPNMPRATGHPGGCTPPAGSNMSQMMNPMPDMNQGKKKFLYVFTICDFYF